MIKFISSIVLASILTISMTASAQSKNAKKAQEKTVTVAAMTQIGTLPSRTASTPDYIAINVNATMSVKQISKTTPVIFTATAGE